MVKIAFLPTSIFLPELIGSTSFLSRPVLLSQPFGKKINSQKSKETLFLEFPIFLPGLTGSTNFLLRRTDRQ
jgi:2-C-methyl-D-erythritol 4-phosphate cytidylyltransferase